VPARKYPAPGWPAGVPVPDWLTKREACTYLRISRTKFYYLDKPKFDKAGRLIRVGLASRNIDGKIQYEKLYLDQRFAATQRAPDGQATDEEIMRGAALDVLAPSRVPAERKQVSNPARATRCRSATEMENLFAGRIRCTTCGGQMSVGWLQDDGRRSRVLHCGTCDDKSNYDLRAAEGVLLVTLLDATILASRAMPADTAALAEQRAAKQLVIKNLQDSIVAFPSAATDRRIAWAKSLDQELLEARELDVKLALAGSASSRHDDRLRFCRQLVIPAVQGDIDARRQLRLMLSQIDYQIVGDDRAKLHVWIDGKTYPIGGARIYTAMVVGKNREHLTDSEVDALGLYPAAKFRAGQEASRAQRAAQNHH
jgi:hypothetical protein